MAKKSGRKLVEATDENIHRDHTKRVFYKNIFASYRAHAMNFCESLGIFMHQGCRTQRKQNHWLRLLFFSPSPSSTSSSSSSKYWIPANQEAQSRSWSITDGFAHHNTLPSCGAQWMNPPLHTDQSDICAISPTCQRLSYQQCPTKNKLWESKQKNIMQGQVV